MKQILTFVDVELQADGRTVSDYGAFRSAASQYHGTARAAFEAVISGTDFLAGHNILRHDCHYIHDVLVQQKLSAERLIDTLPLSPLLFPKKPYHKLVKDEKLLADELNNPLSDAIKAKDLFFDEVSAFGLLDEDRRSIYRLLLQDTAEFQGFFNYLDSEGPELLPAISVLGKSRFGSGIFSRLRSRREAGNSESAEMTEPDVVSLIRSSFADMICHHARVDVLAQVHPIELAYCLANISVNDRFSILPAWVIRNFPEVQEVMTLLRGNPCFEGCAYCHGALDPHTGLKRYFGFDAFRTFGGEPLQEQAVKTALAGESLLAVFPTGGGKSLTFQIPALMSAETVKGLTVVISPLQSLMKDQVDNLEKAGIHEAVTINGLIDPLERAAAIERVLDGSASILYISPESLRSRTIEHLLLSRRISRFVIDEAHCFSAWGQDFRVDYLYIGKFLKQLKEKKNLSQSIPVSCFTATAKPSVVEDIVQYFQEMNGLNLQVHQTHAPRTNLSYKVVLKETEADKYRELRSLIEAANCPTIVYVNRTKRAEQLADTLTQDGIEARPYHGQMDVREKTANQEAFINGQVDVMTATSAFGMGVDKKDVGLVIHYEISNSLENYLQEAGRAGRDQHIQADCYVLFNEDDLDKHFIMANQTRLNMKEIQQVWQAVKLMTRRKRTVSQSALEIARKAGWDESIFQLETRVTTALSALEEAGYLLRTHNAPRVYADSILCRTAAEAVQIIDQQRGWSEEERQTARRIISKLIGARSRARAGTEDAESRVDYIADQLALSRWDVISALNRMRSIGLLASHKDLTAYIDPGDREHKARQVLLTYTDLERFLINGLSGDRTDWNVKELNERAEANGCRLTSVDRIRLILRCWKLWKLADYKFRDRPHNQHFTVRFEQTAAELRQNLEKRRELAGFILEYLFERLDMNAASRGQADDALVEFSVHELLDAYNASSRLVHQAYDIPDIEAALLYLQMIETIRIEGGFMVLYNPMTLSRLEADPRIRFKKDDYKRLELFYENKMQQIHIVGEYARIMMHDYDAALRFADDYFRLDYSEFLRQYFPGDRKQQIGRNITPTKFNQLFSSLSPTQLRIVTDKDSQYIAVLAGPGSGKTRILVHKLASLILMEDTKYEQLLMLTFSRAAAQEFKSRLGRLIGNAAYFVDIKTFHSYCFDLLGKVGAADKLNNAIPEATARIRSGELNAADITKTVIVIDEAQDMDRDIYSLLEVLMEKNEDMRIIAVGDDDQNIFEFRGSSALYMQRFIQEKKASVYELLTNYRSRSNLVDFANQFVLRIPDRLKSHPIAANTAENGKIRLVQHKHGHLLVPFAEDFMRNESEGSACILTRTNNEALQITGMLQEAGIPSRLIQSNDGFNLADLAELRYFQDKILTDDQKVVIDSQVWADAIHALQREYRRSSMLDNCLRLLSSFSETYPHQKYLTDFRLFIQESKLEDFINSSGNTVIVGTIHKAKGKEFDAVHLLLERPPFSTPEGLRQLYVAFTRARTELSIHYTGSGLAGLRTEGMMTLADEREHPLPKKMAAQAGFKDIYLDLFLNPTRQRLVQRLRSGDWLQFRDGSCYDQAGHQILRFSKSFLSQIEAAGKIGYKPSAAKVSFVVYWQKTDDGSSSSRVLPNELREGLIVLPELYFEQQNQGE